MEYREIMIEVFRKYKSLGYSCLPTKEDKSPDCSDTWKKEFVELNFANAYGIGIKCGKESGGIECMDFDNHQGDATDNLKRYMVIPEVLEIYNQYNLPIEKTQGGGYHLLYRCEKIDGNRKLALRWIKELNRPDAFIETKGEGGYFCCDPTPGYKTIKNDICNIPVIPFEDRVTLIDYAISLNEYSKPSATEYEKGDRPGDIYNEAIGSISEMKGLLQGAGWSEHGKFWTRPGKTKGISASLGVVAPNVFYVFSQNGYPFESDKAYTPFQVLAILKFNSDFSETAKSLPKLERIIQQNKTVIQESELDKILRSSEIDIHEQIEQPPTILQIVEKGAMQFVYKRVFTLGNFSVIIGKAKAKKTFFLTMVTSAILSNNDTRFHQKFISDISKTGKTGVLWFDTEQGKYDSQNTIKRIGKMAIFTDNFRAFNLRPYSPKDRCQIIEYAFKLWGEQTAFCVIDGIADLALGINDEEEATRVTTILLQLTKIYNCHISAIIHQNKNDNFATGHLGSAIMKKAEIIISVAKNCADKRMGDVNCDMSRGIDFDPFSFIINFDGLPEVCGYEKPTVSNVYQKEDPF